MRKRFIFLVAGTAWFLSAPIVRVRAEPPAFPSAGWLVRKCTSRDATDGLLCASVFYAVTNAHEGMVTVGGAHDVFCADGFSMEQLERSFLTYMDTQPAMEWRKGYVVSIFAALRHAHPCPPR
jgi:hypothetical protein